MEADLDYIATLVKLDLLEQFGGRYKFDPVIVERRIFYGYDESEEYVAVMVGYSPRDPMPDAGIINGISRRIRKPLKKMGFNSVDAEFFPADEISVTRKVASRGRTGHSSASSAYGCKGRRMKTVGLP